MTGKALAHLFHERVGLPGLASRAERLRARANQQGCLVVAAPVLVADDRLHTLPDHFQAPGQKRFLPIFAQGQMGNVLRVYAL